MKKDSEHNKNKIELNSMVKVSINERIGQVVEIRDGIALIQLLDNMHYHATLNELTLLRERG